MRPQQPYRQKCLKELRWQDGAAWDPHQPRGQGPCIRNGQHGGGRREQPRPWAPGGPLQAPLSMRHVVTWVTRHRQLSLSCG